LLDKFPPKGPRRGLPEQLAQVGVKAADVDSVVFRFVALSFYLIIQGLSHPVTRIGIIPVRYVIVSQMRTGISALAQKVTAHQDTKRIIDRNSMEPFLIQTPLVKNGAN
jgi:hypothetical protein